MSSCPDTYATRPSIHSAQYQLAFPSFYLFFSANRLSWQAVPFPSTTRPTSARNAVAFSHINTLIFYTRDRDTESSIPRGSQIKARSREKERGRLPLPKPARCRPQPPCFTHTGTCTSAGTSRTHGISLRASWEMCSTLLSRLLLDSSSLRGRTPLHKRRSLQRRLRLRALLTWL